MRLRHRLVGSRGAPLETSGISDPLFLVGSLDLSVLPLKVFGPPVLSSPTPGHMGSPQAPRASSCVSSCWRLTEPLQNLGTAKSRSHMLPPLVPGPGNLGESLGQAALAQDLGLLKPAAPAGWPGFSLHPSRRLFRWTFFIRRLFLTAWLPQGGCARLQA